MWRFTFVLIVFSSNCTNGNFYKENITDLSKCKVHFSKSEGKYNDFFEITEKSSGQLIFDFHFLVLARSDAHILLTPSKTVKSYGDPVYEIVLGAGKNTYSSIRRKMRTDVKAHYRQANLLSDFEPRSFWIHVSKDGLIEVGRETQDVAFLSWKDPDPVPLVYFSLSTWPGIEAKWYYDCNRNTVKMVEPVLNDKERLMNDYIKNYQPFDIPLVSTNQKIDVNLTLSSLFMQLNEKEGKLDSKFLMTQKWIDPKLSWLPADYGGIEWLNLHSGQIWTPNLHIFSVIDEFERFGVESKLFVTYDGMVTYKGNLNLKTWCDSANLNDWPEDRHICRLPIGFYADSNKINLRLVSTISKLENLQFKTEWDIRNIDCLDYSPEDNENPNLEIIFHLKRISLVYKLIYLAPLIVITVGTLLTFWVSPFGYLKMALASFNLCLITVVSVQTALNIPGHPKKVPKILLAYNCGYFGILLSVLIAIVVINLSRNNLRHPPPRFLNQVVSNETLRKILLLTTSKIFTETPSKQCWLLLACFIDRISFVTYLILCGVGLYILIN